MHIHRKRHHRRNLTRVCVGIVIGAIGLVAATNTHAADSVLPKNARLKAEVRVAFTEGPAWHPSGNVYFSDIANNRIMRRDRTGALHVFRSPSGRTNGMLFDLKGRLVCCEGGGYGSNRRVTRTEHDGTITVLADKFDGKLLNTPNDCAMDSKGRIYFSDPRYRDRTDMQQLDDKGGQIEGVYRIDGPGQVVRIITHEVDRPNGLHVSRDDKFLFVADNNNDAPGKNRKLWRFNLKADGTVDPKSRKLLFDWGNDRGPDGMAMDESGRLFVSAGFNHANPPLESAEKFKAGIYVINPDGGLVETIPVPIDMITNCTFGDADLKTLYITAGHKLWSVRTNVRGFVPWLRDFGK